MQSNYDILNDALYIMIYVVDPAQNKLLTHRQQSHDLALYLHTNHKCPTFPIEVLMVVSGTKVNMLDAVLLQSL